MLLHCSDVRWAMTDRISIYTWISALFRSKSRDRAESAKNFFSNPENFSTASFGNMIIFQQQLTKLTSCRFCSQKIAAVVLSALPIFRVWQAVCQMIYWSQRSGNRRKLWIAGQTGRKVMDYETSHFNRKKNRSILSRSSLECDTSDSTDGYKYRAVPEFLHHSQCKLG